MFTRRCREAKRRKIVEYWREENDPGSVHRYIRTVHGVQDYLTRIKATQAEVPTLAPGSEN